MLRGPSSALLRVVHRLPAAAPPHRRRPFVIAIDGVLEQIEAVQPHLALLAGLAACFCRVFLCTCSVRSNAAIELSKRFCRLEITRFSAARSCFAGGSEPLVAQFLVAAEQFSEF